MQDNYLDKIIQSLRRITRAIDSHSHRLASQHGLTGPQLTCLRSLAQHGELSPSRLADEVQIGRASMTGIVDRLAEAGLVRRARTSKDRRVVTLVLTSEGRKLVESAPPPLQDSLWNRLERVPREHLMAIDSTLEQVVQLLDAERFPREAILATGAADSTAQQVTDLLDQPGEVKILERGADGSREPEPDPSGDIKDSG